MADEAPHPPPSTEHPPSVLPVEDPSPPSEPPEATPLPGNSSFSVAEEEAIPLPAAPALEKEELPPPPAEKEELCPPSAAAVETEELPPLAAVTVSEMLEKTPRDPDEKPTVEEEADNLKQKQKLTHSLDSFKVESNKLADLSDSERKSLQELKDLVQEALDSGAFANSGAFAKLGEPEEEEKQKTGESSSSTDELSIWGIPLLKNEQSDVILLKFLRARDFKVKDAFVMLRNTICWRKQFKIDDLIKEDLGDELEKVVFMHGHDRDGHSVCYNVYGEFQNKELYERAFGDEEKRSKFLRWRVQFLERSIRSLDFTPSGVNTIFQISDLKNSPGPGKRELRQATKQALQMLQDNYPEFVTKQVFINVPWWYLAFYAMLNPFLTQRTKSKFVFASPAKTPETLFKYISPEQVPVQYGGLSVDYCDCNPEFTVADPATEMTVKPRTKQIVEIIIYEKCVIVWEIRVVGWEVSYGAEFVPDAEGAYTIVLQKAKKMAPTDEPVIQGSFKVTELGRLLLIVDNPTQKKKKLLYRFKVDPLTD